MLMKGKRGLIVGIRNSRSIAYGIAKACKAQGAEIILTGADEKGISKMGKISEELGAGEVYKLDVATESEFDKLKDAIEKKHGKLDFVVHAVAFAPKDALSGKLYDISKGDFEIAMNISVFSFIELCKKMAPLMNDGCSVLTLTYLGGPRYVPNYNLMGVAKAALESSVRYLANDFGDRDIRVNAVSAGPIKTLAASGIDDFSSILKVNMAGSPMNKNINLEEVGNSSMYLLSDLAKGVTGEVHYVDAGYNTAGVIDPKNF